MYVVFLGPDRDLASSLETLGETVVRIGAPANGETLRSAGIEEADLLVLTDIGEATVVPVAREINPGVRIVVYTPDSLPEFVRGMVDVAVSPAVLDPSVVAEELVGTG